MTKSSSWAAFSPSFSFSAIGQLRDLEEAAYREARPLADAAVASATDKKVQVEGLLDASAEGLAGPDRWLSFGHLSNNGKYLGSGRLPYRLTIDYDGHDEIENVALTIFLTNPGFSLNASDLLPGRISSDKKMMEVLASSGGRLGFALIAGAENGETQTHIFKRLSKDLPKGGGAAPTGFKDYGEDTLLGRLDLTCIWKKEVETYLGAWKGIPGGDAIGALGKLARLKFFSSETDQDFQAFVHKSRKFALCLPEDPLTAPALIFAPPKKPDDMASVRELWTWKTYRLALQELGLDPEFQGLLVQGLVPLWIEDDLSLSSPHITFGVDVLAISFGSDMVVDGHGKVGFGVAVSAQVKPLDTSRPFLGWFTSPAALRFAGGKEFRYLTLEGTFASGLGGLHKWIEGRRFSLSVVQVPWKDAAGAAQRSWSIELGLEKADNKYLARVPLEKEPDLVKNAFVALSFAPIIFMTADPPKLPGPAPDAQSRGYFVQVQSGENIAQVFAAVALGKFLEERIHLKELRVTAAHLRSQPAVINDPRISDDRLETAFLLDYDIDYDVDLGSEAGIKTTKIISTHIDGTGFSVSSGGIKWVQVPTGTYEIGLADPGLWELGGLGKFLKLTDIRLRKAGKTYIVIRLRLAQNFGGVKADDFEFSVDLTSGHVQVEAFPAEVAIDLGPSFQGRGALHISDKNGERDVAGGIDLIFKSLNFRLYGGLRITHVKDGFNERHLALLASLSVEWPTKIPLLNTGFGIGGLQLLYATHFLRNELPKTGAIPPALRWLQDVGGDVPESVEKPNFWNAKYGRRTIGIGLEAGPMISKILNINGLLAIEDPGPRIIVFVKVTLLKGGEKNKDNQDLTKGILGLLEYDVEEETLTLAAFADLKFGDMLQMKVPIELGGRVGQWSKWHIYLGHFASPVTVDLNIFSVIKAGAQGYLMFDGDQIVGLPDETGAAKTLPGLAVAFGLMASVKIGGGPVYLEVTSKSFLQLSISEVLYAKGSNALSGILHLWAFDVGATGRFDFTFLREPSGKTLFRIAGEICGRVKVWTWSISGCVRVSLGPGVPDTTTIEDLVQGFSIVPGANAVMLGQGAFNPVDAAQSEKEPIGLDSILVISMNAPPTVTPGGDFTSYVKRSAGTTEFQLGTKKGGYTLTGVTLKKLEGGAVIDVDYAKTPARWWRNVAKQQQGGHPSPVALALNTRNPLNFENAILNPGAPGGIVDEMLDGLCDSPIAEQSAVYLCYPPLQAMLESNTASVEGVLGTSELESKPGYGGISKLRVEVLNVAPYDVEAVHVLKDVVDDLHVPGIVLNYFYRNAAKLTFVKPQIKFSADGFWRHRSIQVCLVVPREYREGRIVDLFRLRRGGTNIPIAAGTSVQFLSAGFDEFVDGMHKWKDPTKAFGSLEALPEFSLHVAIMVTIDLKKLGISNDPTEIVIGSQNNDISFPETIVVGPVKLTPSAEVQRVLSEKQHKQELKEELNDYLESNDLPLLQPNTEYVVEIEYQKTFVGEAPVNGTPFIAKFKTSPTPPLLLTPYLLATYPAGRSQRCMPSEDFPAVLLSTHDIIRILAAYDVRLKVTITHDGGASLKDSTGAIDWEKGATFAPEDLRKPSPPVGILTQPHRGWKSATGQAIDELRLPCLNYNATDRALWVGFDVGLHSSSSYCLRLDLVDGKGKLINDRSQPFFQLAFSTGLYPRASSLAAAVAKGNLCRRRMFAKMANLGPARPDEVAAKISIVPDKAIEDALWLATGERQASSGQSDTTILFTNAGEEDQACAVVVRSIEPILTSTVLPKSGTSIGEDGSPIPKLLGPEAHSIWGPTLTDGQLPKGVAQFVISESGLVAVLVLDSTAGQQDLIVRLERRWNWIEGSRTKEKATLIEIPAAKLKPRTSNLQRIGSWQ